MRRFFAETIEEITDITGDEANHIINVLRMQPGDQVILFDGSGYDFYSEIISVGKGTVRCRVNYRTFNENEPAVRITLYAAAIKKDKLDFVLQKTSELGIDCFCVFDAARSVKRIKDADKMREHLHRVVIEASKQCGRSAVPDVQILGDTGEVAACMEKHDFVVFAYEDEKNTTIKDVLRKHNGKNIGIIVGPEGGFDKEEVRLLTEKGAFSASLGSLILRAETAGIAAVAMVIYDKEIK